MKAPEDAPEIERRDAQVLVKPLNDDLTEGR
jgi:hypothetical protein